jgi:asparagine synthase (glutamine-hydrolysing)
VRLDAGLPAAAELSGGLDSSSIVCMADHLIQSGSVTTASLTTFSYFMPDSPDHRFIAIAEKACRAIAPVHLEVGLYPMLTPSTPGGVLPIWAEARFREVQRRMRESGLRTLLTGQLGDLITGNLLDDSEQAADCLRRGQIGAGVKEALAWARSMSKPVYGVLWRAARAAASAWRTEGRSHSPSQLKRLRGFSELRAARGALQPPVHPPAPG